MGINSFNIFLVTKMIEAPLKSQRNIELDKLFSIQSQDTGLWSLAIELPENHFQKIRGYEGSELNCESKEFADFIIQEIRIFFFGNTLDISEQGEIEGMAGAYLMESAKQDAVKDFDSPQIWNDIYFDFCDAYQFYQSELGDSIEAAKDNPSQWVMSLDEHRSKTISLAEFQSIDRLCREFGEWLQDLFNNKSFFQLVEAHRSETLNEDEYYWLSKSIPQGTDLGQEKEIWSAIRAKAGKFGWSDGWNKLLKEFPAEIFSGAQFLGFQFGSHLLALFCLIHDKGEHYYAERMMHLRQFLFLGEEHKPIEPQDQMAAYMSAYTSAKRYYEFALNKARALNFGGPEDKYLEYKATFKRPWPYPSAEKKNEKGQNLFESGGKFFESIPAIERSIEYSVLKTLVGFLNSEEGGRLVIGIHERGTDINVIGIEYDDYKDEDAYSRALSLMIDRDIGSLTNPTPSSIFSTAYIDITFEDFRGSRVCVCGVKPYKWPENGSPAYLSRNYKKATAAEREPKFFVRKPASTEELNQLQLAAFMAERKANST